MNNQEIMNKPLTAEEAKNLTFPCLLEVWDFKSRDGHHALITHMTQKGHFVTPVGAVYQKAAIPSPEIAEAMRKQFAPKSEYPKRMLVWDDDESKAEPRIVLADLGEKVKDRYIIVHEKDESEFEKGEIMVSWSFYEKAKPIPEVEDQLREQLSELEKQLEIITQQINGIKTQIK